MVVGLACRLAHHGIELFLLEHRGIEPFRPIGKKILDNFLRKEKH